MLFQHTVITTTWQSHLLNGIGAGLRRTGGKDIKVPKYTLKKWVDAKNRYVEWDVDCPSDELDAICNEYNAERVLKFPGVVSSQGSLLSKTSDGWKDNLKIIKDKSGRGNTIKV